MHLALNGASWMRSYILVQCVRGLIGQSLSCSAVDAGRREAMMMAAPATMTHQYHLASMTVQLSSGGTPCQKLPPSCSLGPSFCGGPGVLAQGLLSSPHCPASQPLCPPVDPHPSPGFGCILKTMGPWKNDGEGVLSGQKGTKQI